MKRIDVQVLVVGAGGSGLALTIFLGDLGIDVLTVERHVGTSHLPKAHYINQRSMEIFRHHGLAEAIYERSAPRELMGKIRWHTSLGGDGPLDGISFLTLDAMGAGGLSEAHDAKGSTHATHIPQLRLEPILLEVAEERGPGRIRFQHELLSFHQGPDGVLAHVRNHADGEDLEVRAQYLIGADGGKTVGPQIGATMVGEKNVGEFYSVYFRADLSRYLGHNDSVMRKFFHPETPYRLPGLLTFGPEKYDADSSEFVANFTRGRHLTRPSAEDEAPSDDTILAEAMSYLKLDEPVELLKISRWTVDAVVADTFSSERVFLIGDAAHRHPPTSGLGLNSGFQDAHNIAWKLALVLRGLASRNLLDTYEVERRPVVTRNAEWALFSMTNWFLLMAGFGAAQSESPAEASSRFQLLLEDSPMGETRRAQMAEIGRIQRVEYGAHDMEMGFTYPAGAVVDDNSPAAPRDPMGANYVPTTRPGSRLPHVWLWVDGQRRSTHDLIPIGGFLLLTSLEGTDWCEAATRLSTKTGIPVSPYRIGPGGDAVDPDDSWGGLRGTAADGVVLVRPDGHVAFRSPALSTNPYGSLRDALEQVLAVDLTSPNSSSPAGPDAATRRARVGHDLS